MSSQIMSAHSEDGNASNESGVLGRGQGIVGRGDEALGGAAALLSVYSLGRHDELSGSIAGIGGGSSEARSKKSDG